MASRRLLLLGCFLIFFESNSFLAPSRIPNRKVKLHNGAGRGSNLSVLLAINKVESLKGISSVTLEKRNQQRDVVIIGGALAGLSTALYLSQMDPSRHITILDREEYGSDGIEDRDHAQPSSFAAAGMLAPQSERLPPGPLLDLCVASRRMYGDFCNIVETLAEESGQEGEKYLFPKQFKAESNEADLEPWSVGYVGSGGFLAPAFAGDSVATWSPPDEGGSARWLDSTQIRELEPYLHPDVIGGWWFPDDASVDARRLTCSLRAACVAAGVQLLNGPQYEVSSLDLMDGVCRGVFLKSGQKRKGRRYVGAKTVLVANGAWMRDLLPVPVEPHKGQSLSLRMPADRPPLLRRVLFAQDTYIVPKADGRIVVGATVEAGSFDANVTPSGILHILHHALQLVPGLDELPIEETWVGLRPTTPDKGPILGETPWDNLLVAGGYWRNGVLLAPKTGHLLASLIMKSTNGSYQIDQADQDILDAFKWNRFTDPGKSAALTANIRYSSSLHPIHKRGKSSATIGAELGTYSSASASKEDRQKDREALFADDSDEAFERAAQMGKDDIAAYDTGEMPQVEKSHAQVESSLSSNGVTVAYDLEGAADALTVGIAATDEPDTMDLAATKVESIYERIEANRAERQVDFPVRELANEDRPDPGFRIYHVDEKTGEEREVPPYTSEQDFFASIRAEKRKQNVDAPVADDIETYNEQTYDGYQAIQDANSRLNREEELQAMREARRRNRLDQDQIDESSIGVIRKEDI